MPPSVTYCVPGVAGGNQPRGRNTRQSLARDSPASARSTPVVASSHPSLDEACGEAAIRVDPTDAESIAAGIREALERRDELVRLGLEHAARFSWTRTGAAMLAALEERV